MHNGQKISHFETNLKISDLLTTNIKIYLKLVHGFTDSTSGAKGTVQQRPF